MPKLTVATYVEVQADPSITTRTSSFLIPASFVIEDNVVKEIVLLEGHPLLLCSDGDGGIIMMRYPQPKKWKPVSDTSVRESHK